MKLKPEEIRARMGEITARLDAIDEEGSVSGSFTPEQIEETDALSAEFSELNKQLETADKIAATKAAANTSTRRTSPAPASTSTRVEVVKDHTARFGGFQNGGEFLTAVKNAGLHKNVDPRLQNFAKESIGEDGGFLVPEEMSSAILKKLAGDDSLMAKANFTPVSGNSLTLKVDETQPWNGGVRAYWMSEGSAYTGSKPKFKEASWRLHKLGAIVEATDELLDDATALEGYIMNAAPNAIMYEMNKAMISGNGVGKPQGIINSGFTVSQAAESMQTADTVVAANILKMYSKMFPFARANAAWYIHPQVEEQLRLMVDPNGDYLYIAPGGQMNATPYATLLGRPVIPMMGGMPALGDVGDIIFADWSYFYGIRKAAGVKSATSIHLKFDQDITSFKFSLRVDGKCPFTSPVTTEFGSYQMSGFVTLAAR